MFEAVKEKKTMKATKLMMNDPIRDQEQISSTNTNKRSEQNKRKVKEVKRLTKERQQTRKKIEKSGRKRDCKTSQKASWYCHGCEMERIADMRQCKECQKWYHEECVGLTTADREQFVCPDCN